MQKIFEDITRMKGNPLELGTQDIGKLLLKYALPSIIATVATAIYTITDSIFIGHGVGALGISGLAITFPLLNLAAAFGIMVGVGSSTLLSMRLGQKDYQSANNILGNLFSLCVIIGAVYSLIIIPFLKPILYFFGASHETLPYAYEFMLITTGGTIITYLYFGLNALLRASGNPTKSMVATILMVTINIVLNPLFIFVFKWGMKGSALATIISQLIVLIWQIFLFSKEDSFLKIEKKAFILRKRIVIDSVAIGMSPFLLNATASVIVVLINRGLLKYGGDLAVGAYGIVNRVAMLFVLIIIGLNQGMQPIAGYNYGAKHYDRVVEVLKKSIYIATIVMTVGFIIAEIIPHHIASIFTTDKDLISKSETGIRIVFMFYPLVGFQIVVATFFQSIGKPGKAIFLSLTRQVIFLIPCLLILPKYLHAEGVWLSMPAADIASVAISLIMILTQIKEFKSRTMGI